MSDLYSEHLVKKATSASDILKKTGLIALIVLFVLGGIFIHAALFIGVVVAGILCYVFLPYTDLEYEYLFVNGSLDIDAVMAKSKRKSLLKLDLKDVDLVAPDSSHRLDYYNQNKDVKILDYSSGISSHRRFALIMRLNDKLTKVIIEPDEIMEKAIKNSAPNKVFLD